jgi:hypothetical protein
MLVLLLAACGGANKQGPTATTKATALETEGQPCTQEVALVCPDGQIDACTKALEEKPAAKPEDEESGGSGTAMALDEGRMGKLERAGNHRCVAK